MKKWLLSLLMLCALGVAVVGVVQTPNQPALVADEPKTGGGTG
jgi:hypothetical protein